MNHNLQNNKRKYNFNFFLTKEEKDLFFTLKDLYRLNNELGNDNEKFSEFIEKMTCYYKQILVEFKNNN